jgi:sulfur carrier protein ThiS
MRIEVNFMASYAISSGVDRLTIDIPEKSTIADLLKVLGQQFEKVLLNREQTIVAVNNTISPRNQILNDGEKVLIFDLMRGG